MEWKFYLKKEEESLINTNNYQVKINYLLSLLQLGVCRAICNLATASLLLPLWCTVFASARLPPSENKIIIIIIIKMVSNNSEGQHWSIHWGNSLRFY